MADPGSPQNPLLYFVAGEASGDRHAAAVLRELRTLRPHLRASGVGGPLLAAAGQNQLFDLAAHAVVGLIEVLKNYPKFRTFYRRILADIEAQKPDAVILVDYPGLNLRLAKALRSRHPHLKLIYFISPQVWAWKPGRARLMADTLDLLLVLFPFEADWFKKHQPSLPVTCVGHPLLDRWRPDSSPAPDDPAFRIALLPGSREPEIRAHLPIMLAAARELQPAAPQLTFNILAANSHCETLIHHHLARAGLAPASVSVSTGYSLTQLSRSQLAWVASGTATVECAVAGVPMLVLYKVNPITYWVGRHLIQVPYLAMVNLLAGEKIVPEFLQNNANPDSLIAATKQLLAQPARRRAMIEKLALVVSSLGGPGASRRAAEAILQALDS
ncbi:MAG: lipid-A-disaccharide synthase [Verrucomicrobiia bacterium]